MSGNFGLGNICEDKDDDQVPQVDPNETERRDGDSSDSADEYVPIAQLLNANKNNELQPLKKHKTSTHDEGKGEQVESTKFQFKVPKQQTNSITKKSAVKSQFKAPAQASTSASASASVNSPVVIKGADKGKNPKSKSDTMPKLVTPTTDEKLEKVFQMFQGVTQSELDDEVDVFCTSMGLKLQKVPPGEMRKLLFQDINRFIIFHKDRQVSKVIYFSP